MEHMLLSPENMKRAREKSGLTQKTAAEQLGLSVQTLQAYEQGRFEPLVENIRKMSRLYGISFIV